MDTATSKTFDEWLASNPELFVPPTLPPPVTPPAPVPPPAPDVLATLKAAWTKVNGNPEMAMDLATFEARMLAAQKEVAAEAAATPPPTTP